MRYRLAILITMLALLLPSLPAAGAQAAAHRAGLVIRAAGNRVATYVVSFSEESISGAEVLRRALGGALEMDSGMVAAISGVGCHPPKESAFCQCQGGACTYWRYYHLAADASHWVYSNQGAEDYQVHDGVVEGWAWASSDTPPPLYTFAQLTAASATPTHVPSRPTLPPLTRTPSPLPTAAPLPPTPTATGAAMQGGPPFATTDTAPTATMTGGVQQGGPPPPPSDAAPQTSNLKPQTSPLPSPSPTPSPCGDGQQGAMNCAPTVLVNPPPTQTSNLKPQTLLLLPFILATMVAGRRRGTGAGLNSRTWLVWLAGALLLVSTNPYALGMLLLACLSVYLACVPPDSAGVGAGTLLRFGLVITLFVTLFNFLTAHYGTTVLLRLPRNWPAIGGPLTLEGLVMGLLRGLLLLALLAVFAVFNRVVDHYQLLKLVPRPLYRVGLVASIAVAFVPQTLAAAGEIGAAQQLRGYRVRVRDMLPLFAPLLTLGLEKAIQMAEALETRGWGYTAPHLQRTAYRHVVWHRADYLVIAASGLLIGLALAGRMLGWSPDYYPYPSVIDPDFSPLAVVAYLLLLTPVAVAIAHHPAPATAPTIERTYAWDKQR